MQPFSVKCHQPGRATAPNSFYILSRGMNTGRPSYTPNRNCYVLTCAQQDLELYYWVVFSLWYTRKFEPYLRGTCVELMLINDLKDLIAKAVNNSDKIMQQLPVLQKMLTLETKMQKQIQLIKKSRHVLLQAV